MQFLFKNVIAYLDGEKKHYLIYITHSQANIEVGEPKLTSPLFENRIIE